jgi:sugar phosphate isomerase/epimerase
VSIAIGTVLKGLEDPAAAIRKLAPMGFESFTIMFWQTLGGADLERMARTVRDAAVETRTVLSALSIYGNPLLGDALAEQTQKGLDLLIDAAPAFGTDLVGCFTGRVKDRPIEESIKPWKDMFSEHVRRAEANGVRIGMENCRMGGTWKLGGWNIAINPDAWEILLGELPSPNLGLEWEPCHALLCLEDPVPQLRRWAAKVFHVHGKDANVYWDVIREKGLFGRRRWADQRTAGFGDTDWAEVFRVLAGAGFGGAVDIEGWNDPVYTGERELEGQVLGLQRLKADREKAGAASP